jgi:hypothetical protein
MIADYNLNALVFDDRENEAEPLIKALNYERIPNIFINFKNDDRDDKKVQNIRIIFADLIIGEYQGGEISSVVEAIRTSILDNISKENGPFILAAWSKHSDFVSTLKSRILEVEPELNFIAVKLDKNDYFEKNGEIWDLKDGITFQNIRADIATQLQDLAHIEIFLEWEKDARNSISRILNNFLEDISNKEKIEKTVSSTIKSTLGKKITPTSKDKLDAFYHTLNSTLADSIDNNVSPETKHDSFLGTLDLDHIDQDMKAEINRKTLFEECINNDLKTGNIYSFEDFKSNFSEQVLDEICGYNEKSIFDDEFFKHDIINEIKDEKENVIDKICNTLHTAIKNGNLLGNSKFSKECKELTKTNYYPILMEFTPSCDVANGKYLKSRLIYGYLIDSKYKCFKKSSDSLYITSFHFSLKNEKWGISSNYRLAFFIKNIFAVNPKNVREMTPIIRARKEFVTDLQHAIANHISRIGISSIDGDDNDRF